MKRKLQKLMTALCMAAAMSLLFGTTALADGSDTVVLDFEETVMHMKPGETKTIRIWCFKDFTYYVVGSTSKYTYLDTTFHSGSSDCTFHIGEDETSGKVVFYFYPEDRADKYDTVEVIVEQSAAAASAGPALSSAPVAFLDGTTGTLTGVLENKAGLFSDANGVPVAAFSLSDANGRLLRIQPRQTLESEGFSFPCVTVPGASANVKLSISDADKAAMLARGVYGLIVNGRYITW